LFFGFCHTPRKRGIQYAAASRFCHEHSGILGRPLSRAMTSEITPHAILPIKSRSPHRRAGAA
jgi:hypothetical protein